MYASGPVAIEALEHFDPAVPSLARGADTRSRTTAVPVRKATPFSLPLTGDKWFDTPRPIVEPDKMRSLCVDWASAVAISSVRTMSRGHPRDTLRGD